MNRSLCRTAEWNREAPGVEVAQGHAITWSAGFWRAFAFQTGRARRRGDWLEGFVGFATPEEALYGFLRQHGALAIKANLLMWGTIYLGRGSFGMDWVDVDLRDFADRLGFRRDHGRTHDPTNLLTTLQTLEVLTRLEIAALYRVPGKDTRMLKGLLWNSGMSELVFEERSVVPLGYRFRTGDWFSHAAWRRLNEFTGIVGRALFSLHNYNDKWAVALGAYLACLAPTYKYRDRTLKTSELMEKIGLGQEYDRERQARQKLGQAFDRLAEVGVVGEWGWGREAKAKDRVLFAYPESLKREAGQLTLPLDGAASLALAAKCR